jgi:hypothetical protein
MPSPAHSARLLQTSTLHFGVALEPAISALDSLMLLNSASEVSGLDEWVTRTAAAIPPDVRYKNRLVLHGLYFALSPERQGLTFPAYVDDLAACAPEALRDRLLDQLISRSQRHAAADDLRAHVLASAEAYLAFLHEHFPTANIEDDIETEVHRLLLAPEELREVLVSHLRLLWDKYMAAEWRRLEPLLTESVQALGRVPLDGLSALEAVRAVTGHHLLGERQKILGSATEIIFVPSVHTGPYLDTFQHGDRMWLIFGARLPEASADATSALSRSDLLVRLSALTDDTRLRMLALLSHQGELCSQDIMARLQLTQCAAPAHAIGYLASPAPAQRVRLRRGAPPRRREVLYPQSRPHARDLSCP